MHRPCEYNDSTEERNETLWSAIFDNYNSVNTFCKQHPLLDTYKTAIGKLLKRKESPFRVDGEFRAICRHLENATGIPAEVLFYKEWRDQDIGFKITSFTDSPGAEEEVEALPAPLERIPPDREQLAADVQHTLKTLTYRERETIKLRFGLGNEEGEGRKYTLVEVGEVLKIKSEWVRQIEAKALRKLQHPTRTKFLSQYVTGREPEDYEDR